MDTRVNKHLVANAILKQMVHSPTSNQEFAIKEFANFMFTHTEQQLLFLLTGYAGTGKTTLISAIVKALDTFNIKTVLLAPTGRAAKVSRYRE